MNEEKNTCCNEITETITVDKKYFDGLLQDNVNLYQQIEVKDTDLNCKIEIIAALEGLILTIGTDEMQVEMAKKIAEIMIKEG